MATLFECGCVSTLCILEGKKAISLNFKLRICLYLALAWHYSSLASAGSHMVCTHGETEAPSFTLLLGSLLCNENFWS